MSDFTDLRRAILFDPFDDTVRLVFADLVEEQRQPERAEFIRLQVRMASMPEYTSEFAALKKRERELIVAHGGTWREGYPRFTGIEWGPFIRGFIGGVEARRWSDFAACAEQLFELEPIQQLEIHTYTIEMLQEMKNAPIMKRLTRLDLNSMRLPSSELAPLLRSEHLESLTELHLVRDGLDDRVGTELFGSPVLSKLRRLKLNGNRFTPGSLRRLKKGMRSSLESLNLSENPIESEGLEILVAADVFPNLTALDLWGCGLADAGIEALVRAPWSSAIRVLDLTNNRISTKGAMALAASPNLENVVRIDLRYNQIPIKYREQLTERFGDRVWVG